MARRPRRDKPKPAPLRLGQNVHVTPRVGVMWRGVVHSFVGRDRVRVVSRERGAWSRQPLEVARSRVSPALLIGGPVGAESVGTPMSGQHTSDVLRRGYEGRISPRGASW